MNWWKKWGQGRDGVCSRRTMSNIHKPHPLHISTCSVFACKFTESVWVHLQCCRAVHLTLRCTLNQPGLRVHMNPTWNLMHIECALHPIHFLQIQTGSYCYSWFTWGYAHHEIFGLLIGLACGVCNIASFCSALAAMLEKKEACFLMAEKSDTAW